MSIDTGNVTFCVLRMSKPPSGPTWPEEWTDKMRAHACPPISALGTEPVSGWAGAAGPLDTSIGSVSRAGYTLFHWVKIERRIQPALYHATCDMEEKARREAEDRRWLDRATRAEIHKEIRERMLPKADPFVHAIQILVVYDLVYVFSASVSQIDTVRVHWLRTFGVGLIPVDCTSIALTAGRDVCHSPPMGELVDGVTESNEIGREFLLWLWHAWEAGVFPVDPPGPVGINLMIEGPIQFHGYESCASGVAVRGGQATSSIEADTALKAGKLPIRFKVTLAEGDDRIWTFGFDPLWTFRSMKLPEVLARDRDERFNEHVAAMTSAVECMVAFAAMFLGARLDPDRCRTLAEALRTWIHTRRGKR
jgi:hypothetical protein